MIPIVVPIAAALDASIPICLGAALSGGLFGDQTSPISDTTVLSSMSSGVNHMAHVETQIPYALITASFAFAGFIFASLTPALEAPYLSFVTMFILMGATYFVLSKMRVGRL